jgi:hypothetical protein
MKFIDVIWISEHAEAVDLYFLDRRGRLLAEDGS